MRGVKKRQRGDWKRMAIFAVLLLVLALISNSLVKVYKNKKEAERALAQMQAEVAELEEREKYLQDSLEKLDTEEGVKFEIRKRLNVAEAGESVAIIVEEEPTTSAAKYEVSAWQKIKNFLSGLFR